MRIRSLETIPVALPFREPYVTATGTLERREMILVRLAGGDGAEGWGDAVPLSLRGGASLAEIDAQLNDASELLQGLDARDDQLDACRDRLDPPALAAIDAALLDLEGQITGAPVWKLLGTAGGRVLPCNGTLGAGPPAAVAVAAAELASSGFGTLKVKVGTGDDRERMQAVREAVGPAVALRIDANGAWDVEAAAGELGWMNAEVGLELAEQPCPTLPDLAALRERCEVPLVADESVATPSEAASAVALGACDAATLKLAKVGGPREALRIASALPCYLSSALDSPLGIAAAAHTAQALPGEGFVARLAHGLATSGLFADNVASDINFRHHSIALTAAPGLGVEIDREAVERLRIR